MIRTSARATAPSLMFLATLPDTRTTLTPYTPAPYVSRYAQAGQKWLARSTDIMYDTRADITLESHLIPFMSRPEMSVDVTITTA